MMKHYFLTALASLIALQAHSIDVHKLFVAGPYPMPTPIITDSLDASCNKVDTAEVLFSTPLSLTLWKEQGQPTDSIIPAPGATSLTLAGFTIENTGFAKCKISVSCRSRHKVYVDGEEAKEENHLVPGRHDVSIKLLQKPGESDTLRISVDSAQEGIAVNPAGQRYWTLSDLMHGERLSTTSLSSGGKYLLQNRRTIHKGGNTTWSKEIIDLATGHRIPVSDFLQWACKDDRYIRLTTDARGTKVFESVDVETGHSDVIGKYDGPGETRLYANDTGLIVYETTDGPKESDNAVRQILQPDDRQPGWRNRTGIKLMDFRTGIVRQLALGVHGTSVSASDDGSKLLVSIHRHDITRRPFYFTTILLVDAATLEADTLVREDGFIHSAQFSPDAKQVMLIGSPEALAGIGNTLPQGRTPSMVENELYITDLDTRQARCLTTDFDPSIQEARWCRADGKIYALTEDRDHAHIFRIDPKDGRCQMLHTSESYVYGGFSIARDKALLSYVGETAEHSDRTWTVDLRKDKETLVADVNPVRLDGIRLGKCHDWNFVAERGDTIYGCYYLPPYFDESKQYPMLVYYYGGCSPVGRMLDSYYCYQEWAAMGYVVYVLQPSGCSGFGQEFASRHVRAYGDYTADDIIQGTKQFCTEHPFVKADKVGCMGASYGGFMTMYLQTKTDIFAAAMSHAGISNPASYWGFGYWGYSYSAVSAADSYPWNDVDLYSGHAPLFNADKVHTPILFMHGGADTNVPINESIQMFTALKILGRETAFVTVDGENHHILDYNKRIRWHDTIMAWFAKWLQDDPTWWDTLYPAKNL